MEILDILKDDVLLSALLVLLGSNAFIGSVNDALARIASKIPVVGPIASVLIRHITPQFWDWLRRVAQSAEQAVRQAEVKGGAPAVKKQNAVAILKVLEPGLGTAAADRQIEEALARLKADAAEAAKATLRSGGK